MRDISPAFKAHLAQETTTLATCWRAILTNGTILGFTDHSRDIVLTEQLGVVRAGEIPQTRRIVYKSATGYTPSAIEASAMLNVDNLEVEAILNSPDIQEGDLIAGLWDFAKIQIFWVNYADLSMGRLILKSGTIGQISIKNTSFVAEVRGLTQAYATVIGEMYAPLCRANLGDIRCKVDMAQYTFNGTVGAIDETNRVISDGGLTQPGPSGGIGITSISRAKRAVVTTSGPHNFSFGSNILITGVSGVVQTGSVDQDGVFQPGSGTSINNYTFGIADITENSFSIPVDTRLGSEDENNGPPYNMVYSAYTGGGTATPQGDTGYFTFGMVTFTSGLNEGLKMEVKTYVPGLVELQLPMPYPIAVGDTYTIQKGCGKRFVEDCKEGFNNVVNFRGEPHLPGVDQIMRVGTQPEAN